MTDRRLIEHVFPIREVGAECAREKSARKGNPSGLHYWWARKPLSVSRAAILASLLDVPDDESEQERILNLLVDASKWDFQKSKESRWALSEVISLIDEDRLQNIVLLDPFAGSGTIPLEGTRVGLNTISSDLNPVASTLQRVLTQSIQTYGDQVQPVTRKHDSFDDSQPKQDTLAAWSFLDEVSYWSDKIFKRVQDEVSDCYPSQEGEENVAYLWSRTLPCNNPACKRTVPLFVNSWLEKKGKLKGTAFQLVADKSTGDFRFEIHSTDEELSFNPSEGTIVPRGKLRCPFCDEITDSDDLRALAAKGKLGEELVCIATVRDQDTSGKHFRLPMEADIEGLQEAEQLLERLTHEDFGISSPVPNEPLPPEGTLGFRVTNYGMSQWGELFTKRQLGSILLFVKHVRDSHKERLDEYKSTGFEDFENYSNVVTTILSVMVSRMSMNMSRQCSWLSSDGARTNNPFGTISMPMVWDFSETNPLNTQSASWSIVRDATLNALELLPDSNPADVIRSSADALPFSDGEIDLIITDPPYYDAVPYSDMSDYFYIWQKRMLDQIYPGDFSTQLTPKRSEVVENPGHKKDAKAFESAIGGCFSEMTRVLSADGIVVIIFAHKSTEAWEQLLSGVLASGLTVTASWPVETEKRGRPRSLNSASLASSVLIVCRKSTHKEVGFIDDVEPSIESVLHDRLDYFWAQEIRGADFFMSAIGPAIEVFGRYSKVVRFSGEEVGLGELLVTVRTFVADYALKQIVKGSGTGVIDDFSRFYVIWRWAFGTNGVNSGEAISMAQSLGCEFTSLMAKDGLLKRDKQEIKLKGPKTRASLSGLGERSESGMRAPLIDVLHRAASLWEKGDRQILVDFLVESISENDREQLYRLAQSIVDVLPPGDKERALYENFLVGSKTLPKPTAQESATNNQQKLF